MKKVPGTTITFVFLSVLAFCNSVSAHAQTRDENLALAEKAFNEAVELSKADKEDLALQKFQTAQDLYRQIGDKRGEANSLRGIGLSYLRLNKRGESIQAYKEALRLFEEIPRKSAVALTASEIGDIYSRSVDEKELRLAIDYYGKALSLFTEPEDKGEKALRLANIGRAYMLLRNKEKALEFSRQGLSLFQELDDKQNQAGTLSHIGNAYEISLEVEDKRQALEHYRKAIELYSAINSKEGKNGKANASLNSGNIFIFLGNREEAIKSYLQALGLYREIDYRVEVALTLDNLGNAYAFELSEKGKQQAVNSYLESARIYLDIRDGKPDGAEILAKIGDLYFRVRSKEQALNYYKQAQAVYQELSAQDVHFRQSVAKGFNAIGITYEYLGNEGETLLANENYRKAEAIYQEFSELFRRQNKKENLVQALRALGDVRFRLREKSGAIESYKQAANVSKEIPSEIWEAYLLTAVSYTYSLSEQPGDIQQAIAHDQMAQQIFHKIGDKNSEIGSLKRMASGHILLNNWAAFMKANSDLLEIAKALSAPAGAILTAEVEMALANAYQMRGQTTAALEKFNSALSIGKTLKNMELQSDALCSLTQVHFMLGEPKKVLDRSEEFLPLIAPDKDYYGKKGYVHTMRGYAYYVLGDKAKSDAELQLGIQLIQESKDRDIADLATALTGNSYLAIGNEEEERSRFKEVEQGMAAIQNDDARIYALYYLAISLSRSSNFAKALNYAEQALSLSRKTNNRNFEALNLWMIGFIKWERDENHESIALFQQAMTIFRKLNAQQFEVYALVGLMKSWEDAHEPRMAIFYGKQAAKIFQRMRIDNKSLDSEFQKGFAKGLDELYKNLTKLLLVQGRLAEAQQVINLSRDQEFFDLGNDQNQTPSEIQFTPLEQENSLLWEAELNKASQALGELDLFHSRQVASKDPELARKLQSLEAAYQKSYADYLSNLKRTEGIFKQSPGAKDKLTVSEATDMQTALCELTAETKQKTSALYTFIGADRFYVLVNTCNEPVKVFESTITAEDLNKRLVQFYDLLQSEVYDPRRLSKEIYRIIVPQGLETELQTKKVETLMWSLDGNLRYIPMAALSPDGTQYLVERYNNVAFTRANKERMTRKVSFDWTGYGFFTSEPQTIVINEESTGFTSLDKDERQIFRTKAYPKGIIEGDIFSEADFTAESLLNVTRPKRALIHISSHFRFYPGNPDLSVLLLGNGKIMPLTQIKERGNLFQGVELLTLSACETAAQFPNADGKEIDGFAELAQRLGAGSVMASLWSVADISTTELMKAFYRYRQIGKLTKAEALRKSQLDLLYGRNEVTSSNQNKLSPKGNSIKGERFVEDQYRVPFKKDPRKPYAHPFYWSPFVLFGNPK